MTCKDCIHQELCDFMDIVPIDVDDNETDTCYLFSDKSRFVELPCPAEDAELVRHGRWERADKGVYRCSECGTLLDDDYTINRYCRWCGAKMDKKEREK